MKRSRFTEEQIIGVLHEHEAGAGEREVARGIRAAEREERATAKAAAAVELKKQRIAEAAARALAEKEAATVRQRELEEAAERDKALQSKQKAVGDVRYAARKPRR